MITRNLSRAALALLLASPAYAVTDSAPAPASEQLTEKDFDLDEEDLDVNDDLVTEEDLNEDTEIEDTELGKEQEPDDTVVVEPKDDGQNLEQAADEYLAKTAVKDADPVAIAELTPRTQPVDVQLPVDSAPAPEVAPVRQPQAIADALTIKPVEVNGSALVTKIQQALIAQGAAIEADGQMGEQTKQALLDFQKKSGLAADGIAGPATLEKLGVSR